MGLFKPKKKKKEEIEEVEEIFEDEIEEEDVEDEDEVEEEQLKTQPKKPQSNKPVWAIADVVTDSRQVIVNNETGEQYDLYSAVVEILNRTE